VPQQLIRAALDLELQEGTVIADPVGETPCVFLAGLHRAERTIAERLTPLANGPLPWPWIDPDKALPWAEKHRSRPAPTGRGSAITSGVSPARPRRAATGTPALLRRAIAKRERPPCAIGIEAKSCSEFRTEEVRLLIRDPR
jgi:hypothetical protein